MPSYYAHDGEQSPDSAPDVKLTPREYEVLQYLAKGASNKDIARELGLELVTIKLHVRGVFKKLEAKNRTQAVINAQKIGIV